MPAAARGSHRQLVEVSQAPQLRASDPHAPGAKMTGVQNKIPQINMLSPFENGRGIHLWVCTVGLERFLLSGLRATISSALGT